MKTKRKFPPNPLPCGCEAVGIPELHGFDTVIQMYRDVHVKFCPLHAHARELLAALKAWMKVESEMMDNHPCPDLALRAGYRKQAVALTKAAILAAEGQP